jgi:hypothetical protein
MPALLLPQFVVFIESSKIAKSKKSAANKKCILNIQLIRWWIFFGRNIF